jgi:plasmid stability protein
MASLTIRRLDDQVYDALKARARRNGRSLEAEVREILSDRARSKADLVERLRAFQDKMVAKHGVLPDSTPLIREMRETE